mmetsp:Transcript_506/g.1272  ORF Transcript_506/g.1272 Transcript_506/m.1272 type:complete len:641 (+) Transcript_506:121-2043(+)|eukprot:CAMPEP_0113472754 /NCGR_PEP_ID=MMETSP0014_2-20120614/17682_1 /TAXON_ID=2857 /ORGANISM="Nitzschia sp." /LENGTH=640 /DNA_ID=CAMNT_0000365481 /DNA_START=87 /DNA_END=2009 /DNA_ORIENTATION=- /assembly_acc=CAM_ASM_000159
MVSIRKAKQGFQLRRRGPGGFLDASGAADREKIGLVVGGLCVGFLLVVLFQLGVFGEGSDAGGTSLSQQGKLASLRTNKQHPVLMEDVTPDDGDATTVKTDVSSDSQPQQDQQNLPQRKRMDDRYNAAALDLIEFLDCPKILEEAVKSMKSYDADGFGNNGMDDAVEQRRRRLDEVAQQHGDDGGFGNEEENAGGGGGGEEAEDAADPDADVETKDDDKEPEDKWGEEAKAANGEGGTDDAPRFDDGLPIGGGDGDEGGYFGHELNAKHLLCLAASENPPPEIQKNLKCDAAGRKRRTLLDLWTDARAQIQDPMLLSKVLGLAKEHSDQNLLGRNYNIWAPENDDGLQFMLGSLNSDQDADNGGLHGLDESLGPGKVFVDVGSCLGLTCLAVNSKYPGTKIVSFEPASPSWLLQELNLRCNLAKDEFKNFHVVLAGVGPNTEEEDNTMAKLMWRPTSTTSTRTWTPKEEHRADDVELLVRLRRLKSILAEANVYDTSIDVVNVDCEGCEYNLIPALTEEEFDSTPVVLGAVHWGYISPKKLPSSDRAKLTHERMCQHENIAKTTKECCAFPDLHVKSSVPGEVLVKEQTDDRKMHGVPNFSTVTDVIADGLCDDFDKWAEEKFLFDIKEDWGWFELSSEA